MPRISKMKSMKNMIRFLMFVLLLATAGVMVSCHEPVKKTQPVREECPFITLPSSDTLLDSQARTYALSEDFTIDLLKHIHNHEGSHIHIQVTPPEKWFALGREILPSSQELWLVQSEERNWTCLAIVAGNRVKDVLPIGLSIGSQGSVVEYEKWSWKRDEMGGFIVDKQYVKKVDVNDTLNQSCEDYVSDHYIIGSLGLFQCTAEQSINGPQYQLVLLYQNQQDPTDSWEDVRLSLEPFCEENNLLFMVVDSRETDFRNVTVIDYKMELVTVLNITPYVLPDDAGMLLMQNGMEPLYVNYSQNVEFLQMKINKYFKINNLNQ